MARAIQWQIHFKSFKDVDCYVNIYKDGASGTVHQLTGGDIPVYWEETRSDDVLDVVRTKTGYISFIEENFGEWDDVYPTTAIDRYVEVLYGSTVMFKGYLQPQSFDNGYVAPPREIQIPIQSPLMSAQTITFDDSILVGMMSLASVLARVINKIGVDYQRVEFPSDIDLTKTIRASLINPYNRNFNRSDHGEETPTHTPVDIYTFVEGLCNAYGMIVHDTPNALIFMRFNAASNDTYWSYDAPSLPSIVRGDIALMYFSRSFDDVFMNTSDSDTVSNVMPLGELTFNFNSETMDDVDMDFGRCKITQMVYNGSLGYSHKAIAIQRCESDEISGPRLLTSNSINSSYILANTGCMVAAIAETDEDTGKPDMRSGILIQTDPNWAAGSELFRVKIPVPIAAPMLAGASYQTRFGLKLKVSWALNVQREIFHSDNHNDFGLQIGWKFDDEPDPTTFQNVLVSGSNGEVGNTHHTSGLYIWGNRHNDYVTIIVKCGNMAAIRPYELLLIESLGFDKYERAEFDDLSNPPTDELVTANNGSPETAEISQFITTCSYSRNMIGDTPQWLQTSKYNYLLRSQQHYELTVRMKANQSYSDSMYGYIWQLSTPQGTVNARALGIGFDPRNDEFSLIMQTFKSS